jgi:hypothetical protein
MHIISVHDGFLKCYLLKSSQTTKLSQNTDTCIRIIYFIRCIRGLITPIWYLLLHYYVQNTCRYLYILIVIEY